MQLYELPSSIETDFHPLHPGCATHSDRALSVFKLNRLLCMGSECAVVDGVVGGTESFCSVMWPFFPHVLLNVFVC